MSEFANSLPEARKSGERTVEEVAAKFNGLDHRAAQGQRERIQLSEPKK
jgi:hypothetical protein